MQKSDIKKVLFTGAHAGTVALAILEEIREKQRKWSIYFIGPKYSFENDSVPSAEKEYLRKFGVTYIPVVSGKLNKRGILSLFMFPVKLISGFVNTLILLFKIKPDVVISFGGYIGFPVVVNAWLLGIPVILHEQTSEIGLANRASSFFAKKVAVGREEALRYAPKNKSILIGNPIRMSILKVKHKNKIGKPPTIFVFTGSRGSQTINTAIDSVLEKILEKYNLIHLTGKLDYPHFGKRKEKLDSLSKSRYEIYDFIPPDNVSSYYERSDIMICRAGANTVSELMVVKKPAVLIPIPWSIMDEQRKNAIYAQQFGVARILDEDNLTGTGLLSEVDNISTNWEKIINKIKDKKTPDIEASQKFVRLIDAYLPTNSG